MPGKAVVVLALLVALLGCSTGSSPRQAEEASIVQKLLARREKVKDPSGKQEAPPARMERRAHLTEDEREIVTKQIMQAISEMVSRDECVSDRDYQGWVDFGRRGVE